MEQDMIKTCVSCYGQCALCIILQTHGYFCSIQCQINNMTNPNVSNSRFNANYTLSNSGAHVLYLLIGVL